MDFRLVVVDGPESGRVFSFEGADSFLVGRSLKAHLVLDRRADRYISRTHCLIDYRPPRCIVNDLGSTNGTYVNDERIARAEVADGDVIRVGRTKIRVVMSADEPTTPAPSQFRTEQAIDVGGIGGSDWQPPQAGGPWQLPGLGEVNGSGPEVGARPEPPSAVPLSPQADEECGRQPVTACWLCDADLGAVADQDGRAAALPDAIYLCAECEGSLKVPSVGIDRIGNYSVIGEIGRGGMGVVLKGVHDGTRRVCAIKKIHPDVAGDERVFRLFEREISVQSRVAHPNLAAFLDHGREHGTCYFVAEFLAGGDAGRLVNTVFKGPVPLRLAVSVIVDVLAGLDALHRSGFVHRDLKPGNILLSRQVEDGIPAAKITDYGLAKSFEDAGNSLFDFTRDGEAAGSLMYMPPEQILNYRFVRPPADVYAAGVTLYFMLTSQYTVDYPQLGETQGGTAFAGHARNPIEALIEDTPIPILERTPGLPEGLARVIDTSVNKELSQRYQTAAEFSNELRVAARSEGLV